MQNGWKRLLCTGFFGLTESINRFLPDLSAARPLPASRIPGASQVFLTGLVLLLFAASAAAAGPKVAIHVTNAEIRDVLTGLAGVEGAGIVVDDAVSGKITVQLSEVSLETAIDIITKVKGLTYLRQGNVFIIGTPEKMTKGFDVIHVLKLQYAKAEDVKKSIALIIPEDRLKVDEASNALIFTGSAADAARVRQALLSIDIPCKQVSLEAQVLSVNKGAAKSLGVEWQWTNTPVVPDVSDNSKNVTRELPGYIRYGRGYEFQFQAKINALVTNGEARVLSRPKVTTLDGKQARILVGDRIPVLVEKIENGKTSTTTEYIDAGIKLTYTPRINNEGMITAIVHTEVSTPTLVKEMKAYTITTRESETQVRMKDGETIIIGGLISNDESGQYSKIPLLGDLPILGSLFRNTNKSNNETEVIIILTAKIVD